MSGLYFDDFTVGQEFRHEWERTVTEMDNMLFSNMTLNVQPLHISAEFAAKTEFGKPLVNSIFTLGLLIGMSVNDTTLGTTVANLGMKNITFPKPVFHGDTLHAHTKVLGKRESKSRPTAGIIEFLHTATNQTGEVVCLCERSALMHKRPAKP